MKIRSIAEAVPYAGRVREKHDAGGDGQSRRDGSGRERSSDDPKDGEEELDESQLKAAVETFGENGQAKAKGLKAEQVGRGPGLRVVLRDASGAVIRQMTGDEFLKLREALGGDGKTPGKILDQKF